VKLIRNAAGRCLIEVLSAPGINALFSDADAAGIPVGMNAVISELLGLVTR
jgi:hypothetical protein